jgi:Tfp pilus assembly protein PilX
MANILAIIQAIYWPIWGLALLALLWFMLRAGLTRTQQMQAALIEANRSSNEVAHKSAQAAQVAADAALKSAEATQALVTLIMAERKDDGP